MSNLGNCLYEDHPCIVSEPDRGSRGFELMKARPEDLVHAHAGHGSYRHQPVGDSGSLAPYRKLFTDRFPSPFSHDRWCLCPVQGGRNLFQVAIGSIWSQHGRQEKTPHAMACGVVIWNTPARTRTGNPLVKSQLLCQLSYGGGTRITSPALRSSRQPIEAISPRTIWLSG